jgi:hypothetical protein
MKLIKYIAALLLLLIVVYWFLGAFSIVESRFTCSGTMTWKNERHSSQLFLKLQEYRLLLKLFGESDGAVLYEFSDPIVGPMVGHYLQVKVVGDQWQIFEDASSRIKGNLGFPQFWSKKQRSFGSVCIY